MERVLGFGGVENVAQRYFLKRSMEGCHGAKIKTGTFSVLVFAPDIKIEIIIFNDEISVKQLLIIIYG